MNKKNEKSLVPKLRFSEFRDTGEWEVKPLGEAGKNLDSKRVPITEKDRIKGDIPYYGASGVIDYVKDFIFDEELLCISEDGANLVVRTYPIAFSIAGKAWVNNHVHVLKFEYAFTQVIVENYLNAINLEDYLTGMAQPKLNRAKLDIIPIPLPSLHEQQKIADCLSSLDELITAETQKLEAYKDHKKWLMQQLFPAEGETVPGLRFPEFRDAGEWEVKKLIDVADKKTKWSFIGGPFGSNLKSSDYVADGIRIIQLQNIGDAEFFDDYKIFTSEEKADELLANNIYPGEIILSKMGDPVGRACLIPYKHARYVMCSDGIRLVVDEKAYSKYFIYTLINSIQFRALVEKTATGSTRKRIGIDDLKNLPMVVPKPEEQQKIADCLSSLDELITAEIQKLEAYKTHKKGLMQGLFPSTDEVSV
ncbi:restriction endonuclease S subunit [Candidatus Methanoperedens nitroreducens]|uniref:Restriction endonuclease S subunit n=1 Tax=Candidatus Methanoperedens nitratireducens TaxID=1392998 RepID=A0A062V463_9EURY|nr:restriction endonuclease subunit S [Candidatus Methanoperedens nitroreducens]KCZ70599.1 restriction endonuclease S subunit [Candidatus Methanoperedens nitroreducens]MDJ1420453.1 restriction endonuclease subunit S [Candidatus Methanoperedens sp.]